MLSDFPIDGCCFKMTVFQMSNPWEPENSQDIQAVVKWGEDEVELMRWYIEEEFNYITRIEIIDDSK